MSTGIATNTAVTTRLFRRQSSTVKLPGPKVIDSFRSPPKKASDFQSGGRAMLERLAPDRPAHANYRLHLDKEACARLMAFLSHAEMAGKHRELRQTVHSAVLEAGNSSVVMLAELNFDYSPHSHPDQWQIADHEDELIISLGAERVEPIKNAAVQLYVSGETQWVGEPGYQLELVELTDA